MANYSTKEYIKGKTRSAVDIWNERWQAALAVRGDQEDIYSRAYDSIISKHQTTTPGFSNMYFSMSWPYKQATEAQLGMNLFGEKPYVRFEGEGQEDITNVKISEAFTHHFMRRGQIWIEGTSAIQLTLIYGDAWIRYPWVREFREYDLPTPYFDEQGQIVGYDYKKKTHIKLLNFEGFRFEARSPWRVVIDPAAYSPKPERMRWLIDTDARVPYERLEEMAEQGMIDKKALKEVNPDGYQDCGMITRSNRGEDRWQTKDTSKKGLVFIRECIDFLTYRKCIIANYDVILNGENGQQIETLGGPPYQHFGLYNMPLEPYSKGLPWQLEYHEKARNHYINTDMDEYSMSAYPPIIAPTASDLFRDKLLRVKPNIVLGGRPDEYGELRKSTRFAETYNRVAFLEKDAQFITGMSAEATGLTAPTGTTATSSSIAAQQMQLFVRYVTWKLSHCLGEMAVKLNLTAWQMADETLVRVLPAELEPHFETVRGMGGNKGIPPALNVNYVPKDRSYASASMERFNSLVAMFDREMPFMTGQTDPKTGQVTQPPIIDIKERLAAMYRELSIPGWERFFIGGVQENNPFLEQAANQAKGRGMASPQQPQMLGANQRFGNMLGQFASAANPGSNNTPGNANGNQLLGIG